MSSQNWSTLIFIQHQFWSVSDNLDKTRKNLWRILAAYKVVVIMAPLIVFGLFLSSSSYVVDLPVAVGTAFIYLIFLSVASLKVSSVTVLETDKSPEEVRNEFESDQNPIYALFQAEEMDIAGRKVIAYSGKEITFDEKGDTIKFSQRGEVSSSYEVEIEEMEDGTRVEIDNSSEPYTPNKMLVQVIRSRYVFAAIESQGYNIVSGHESLTVSNLRKWEIDYRPLEF